MNRILPVTSRLRAKWSGSATLREGASEVIELSPAIDREQARAISLPAEFDRVVSFQNETTPEIEFKRLQQGVFRHGPTVVYRLDNAVVGDGTLYFKGGYHVIKSGSRSILPRMRDQFADAMLCTNNVVERYFGHWLNDGLTLEMLAKEMSLEGIVLKHKPWLHEPGYRKLSELCAVQTEFTSVDRLMVVDDRGINDSWISRAKKLREKFRKAVKRVGPKRVMLSRGSLGAARQLVNKSDVQEALQQFGFEIVSPESESAANLVNKLASAEIVVVVEGSAQSHCTFALPGGSTVLTIQPANRFTAVSKDRADAVGLNWAFVVADPRHEGFHLPIDRLLRTLDEVSRVTARIRL
jgi:capsular polysaccharide biosynthesis protein